MLMLMLMLMMSIRVMMMMMMTSLLLVRGLKGKSTSLFFLTAAPEAFACAHPEEVWLLQEHWGVRRQGVVQESIIFHTRGSQTLSTSLCPLMHTSIFLPPIWILWILISRSRYNHPIKWSFKSIHGHTVLTWQKSYHDTSQICHQCSVQMSTG